MILIDTSVWIDHLRLGDETLSRLLRAENVLMHPFVIGELALGSLKQRQALLSDLRDLPRAPVASDSELLHFIDQVGLPGSGIGYVDAHLLASTQLTPGSTLWTRDKRLQQVATSLGLGE
ncbi:MAG: type II toxin-antitoxin system VapC family toxin [Candidatus Eremiobacteraeota bacterium]|nr:type II toxin-antitoxin system VapC family toxin [Candidatus Eremiobacteraeota bacterium]